MEALQALEEIKNVFEANEGTKRYADIFQEHLILPIEQALKRQKDILYILKNKGVDIHTVANTNSYEEYLCLPAPINIIDMNGTYNKEQVLIEEEYNLLKNWLKEDK